MSELRRAMQVGLDFEAQMQRNRRAFESVDRKRVRVTIKVNMLPLRLGFAALYARLALMDRRLDARTRWKLRHRLERIERRRGRVAA